MRCVIARVLPVPAPASTTMGPSGCAATSRCSGSRASRMASAEACTGMPWGWVGIAAILSWATDGGLLDQAVDPGDPQSQDPPAFVHHRPPVVVPVRVVLPPDGAVQL